MKEIEIKSNSNCVNLDDCKLVREGIKIVTQLLLRLRKKYILMSSDLVSILNFFYYVKFVKFFKYIFVSSDLVSILNDLTLFANLLYCWFIGCISKLLFI